MVVAPEFDDCCGEVTSEQYECHQSNRQVSAVSCYCCLEVGIVATKKIDRLRSLGKMSMLMMMMTTIWGSLEEELRPF